MSVDLRKEIAEALLEADNPERITDIAVSLREKFWDDYLRSADAVLAVLSRRAATSPAGDLVEAVSRLLAHWDGHGGPEKRGEFEGGEYWSPAGRMVDTQYIADLRSALTATLSAQERG